eukprot:1473839-Ditylum_brightwellii.AAC.1
MNGHKEVVKVLLGRRAAVDAKNKKGYTPLYVASEKEHTEVVNVLLDRGVAVHGRCGIVGWTP